MSHYIFAPLCTLNDDGPKPASRDLVFPPQPYVLGPSQSLALIATLIRGNITPEADNDSSDHGTHGRRSLSSTSTSSSISSYASALDDLVDSPHALMSLSSTTSEAKFRTVGSAAHSIAVSNSLVAVASSSEREMGVAYSPSIEDMAAAAFRQDLEDWQTGEHLGDSYERVFARTRALLELSHPVQAGLPRDDTITWEVNPDSSLVAIPSDWFFGENDEWTASPAEIVDSREVGDPTRAIFEAADTIATTATSGATGSSGMVNKVKKFWSGFKTKMSAARTALRANAQRRRAAHL